MSRQKISLNTLSGPDSRDLSVRYSADRIRVSAWFCQNLSEVPACYLGITGGRVRPFYLSVIPLYGFTKFYTNPFRLIYLLPNFKLPVLVPIWGLEQKNLNSGSHNMRPMGLVCPLEAHSWPLGLNYAPWGSFMHLRALLCPLGLFYAPWGSSASPPPIRACPPLCVRAPPLCVRALGSSKPLEAHICPLGAQLCPLGVKCVLPLYVHAPLLGVRAPYLQVCSPPLVCVRPGLF
jgi:hypothetical protein